MTVDGGVKSHDFLAFLELLGRKLQPGQRVCIDNLQAHKGQKVKNLIRSFGAEPLYLPPYSPDLNPIEAAWSKVTHFARKAVAQCRDSLKDAIRYAFQCISSHHTRGFFRYCGYLCPHHFDP